MRHKELVGRVVACTGHRPQHLSLDDGYWIQGEFERIIVQIEPGIGISGMALGADTWWATEILAAGVPLHAYIPFPHQDSRWRSDDRIYYRDLIQRATDVRYISDHYYGGAFELRNRAMVNDCGLLVAAWNGKTNGGTWNCLEYARKVRRDVLMVDVANRRTTIRRAIAA